VDAILTLGNGHGAFHRLKTPNVKIYYVSAVEPRRAG